VFENEIKAQKIRDQKLADIKKNNPDKFVCSNCYSVSINKTANRAKWEDGYWSEYCLKCYADFIMKIINFNAHENIENKQCPF